MEILEEYTPISTEKITLNDNNVATLTIPTGCSAATVSCFGGFALYSVVYGDPPNQSFGRPIPDGEEVVIISNTWLQNFQIIRTASDTLYIYVTYYRNG